MSKQLDGETEFEIEEPLGNPAPPPDVDLEKLRGDRIGDTVFSGKWCIQTVMKLIQSNVVVKADEAGDHAADVVDMDEELQNEVGALWDMTSNVQVCQYLHSVGAVESICYVISNSRCPRATEMCVGMLANIIYHNELWDIMKEDTSFFSILIQLLTSTDQPVLLEVNRFFNTALCHERCEFFYTTLNNNGQLVVQELLRILSGSTNGDLLKQVTELVYSLMYKDEQDTQFNSRFADPDFVLAVVEASKELGLSHESSGQNYIMEIFHSFTTYEAGVEAIAPSFLHCVLTTLVALYRKLGQYHIISNSSHKARKHQLGTSETTWQSQEEREEEEADVARCGDEESSEIDAGVKHNRSPASGAGNSKNLQGSWSERAFATARLDGGLGSETGAFRTPEASPRPAYKTSARTGRELEVSWSERRLASPLVAEEDEEEDTVEKWKLPRERRRFRRREDGGGNRNKKETPNNQEDENQLLEHLKQESLDNASPKAAQDFSETDQTSEETSSNTLPEHGVSGQEDTLHLEDSSNTLKAMRIQSQDRTASESRLSGGFTPSGTDAPDMDQEKDESTADVEKAAPDRWEDRPQTDSSPPSSSSTHKKQHKSGSHTAHSPQRERQEERKHEDMDGVDVGFDYMEKDDGEDGGEMHKSVGSNGSHKYRALLAVIRDFLVDYLNSMAQVSEEQDGNTPVISATVRYLDQQCSSTELRALTRCVRDSLGLDSSQERDSLDDGHLVLQRLQSMCDKFRASHLKLVLTSCVSNGSS
ncbi:protein saal1-like [Elysia marginata]|uniref:Protein saal1-like n=1 Tax=Elysia marginata TaxID=1093978 RepID=A0AAV4IUZ3_9GAST|nr:protein saal1-like [Elysia marginata]